MQDEQKKNEPRSAEGTQVHVPMLFDELLTEKTHVSTRVVVPTRKIGPPDGREKSDNLHHTLRLDRREIIKGIRIKHSAYLEISGLPDGMKNQFHLEADEIVIGRSDECQLQLPLANVSRRHASLLFRDDEYRLEDHKSTNGTFVNGVRVSKCVLRNNDQIEIGEARILFMEQKVRQS